MAVGESRKNGVISQASWTDGTSLDPYYGLEHSFQYTENINADDELHGFKLAHKMHKTSSFARCQLVSAGDNGVFALPIEGGGRIKRIGYNNGSITTIDSDAGPTPKKGKNNVVPGVVFQDRFRYGTETSVSAGLVSVSVTGSGDTVTYVPHNHTEDSDEAILDKTTATLPMTGSITAILNYNNTRLVVASGNEVRVYYPELDIDNPLSPFYDPTKAEASRGKSGWMKVMDFEAGVLVVGLTCTFEYLKVRAVDEGWNTKVYYYQGNNDLRSTFVYNIVDLTGQKVSRVYPINGIDYYITSIDGSDGYINLYKMIGTTPVLLLKQRAGLTRYDINQKAPYFVGPCSIDAGYALGSFYIADAYGVFKFNYTPNGYDKGYMKWKLSSTSKQVYGLCINKNILYVSTEDGCYATRVYDTGLDGYQDSGVLISRELEGQYGGTVTKMLDEIRLHYELNPLTTGNGKIEVFVSPNNLRESTNPNSDGWYKVMEINQTNHKTRTERTELLNCLDDGKPAFEFDWQTITYAVKITVGSEDEATPIVRQIDLNYHTKDKTNYVYDIN